MIVCDNCNVCVSKHTFCSDKCRVNFHRKNAPVTSGEEVPIKIVINNASVTPEKKTTVNKFINKKNSILFE